MIDNSLYQVLVTSWKENRTKYIFEEWNISLLKQQAEKNN